MNTEFLKTMQAMVAVTAVSPSALRNQGVGVLDTTREYLTGISLTRVPRSSPAPYRRWLDRQTEGLLDNLPVASRPWGAARKAMNLFMRDSLYNRYLCAAHDLTAVEDWLEIPLDGAVVRGLKEIAGHGQLPRWYGFKHLDHEDSDLFQKFALEISRSRGFARVHLDMYLWLENR